MLSKVRPSNRSGTCTIWPADRSWSAKTWMPGVRPWVWWKSRTLAIRMLLGGGILPPQPVDRLTDEVGVSGVSPVLLDQVEDGSAQAGPRAVWPRLLDELVENPLLACPRQPG